MRDGEAYWSVLEPTWDAVSIYDGPTRFEQQFAAAPPKARTLLAAHWCQSEVCNGGFHQFFSNSTGVLAPEAVTAFVALRMPEVSAVVSKAMSWFGPTYPREREERQAKLKEHSAAHPEAWNPFDDLDRTFYRLLDSESGGFFRAADAYALQPNGG